MGTAALAFDLRVLDPGGGAVGGELEGRRVLVLEPALAIIGLRLRVGHFPLLGPSFPVCKMAL